MPTRRLLGKLRPALAAAALALALPLHAQDIVVGQVGPFTVLPVPDAKQVNEGIRACLTQVNARGGINGRRFAFFELDDKYSADTFVTVFKQAMQRKPVALLTPIGSAAIKRMLDDKLLDSHDVVVLNAIPGAAALREPGHARLFHIRAGDREQIEKIVLHAQTLGIRRLSVLYQNIPIGSSGFAAAKEAAAKAGATLEVSGLQTGTEEAGLAEAAKKIAGAGAQAVLVVGAPRYAVDGVAQLRKAGVSQSIFTLSYVPSGLLAKAAGETAARGVGITQTFPNPMGVVLPLQRDFRAAMREAFPAVQDYTSFHLEGYVSARVLVEALRRSGEITPEALARSLQSIGEIDLGGFRVNFGKGNVGSRYVDIGVVTVKGKLMY
ncbi:MAG: ABC transporter substrate-binding protein [Burkholderiales bacterium]|nr:ABC transporter substrate-binding protein [Burkholderiales bacterium]